MTLRFDEQWQIRPPRPMTVDESTGNPIAGTAPDPIDVRGSLEQRFPRTEQREVGDALVDEQVLLLAPAADTAVPGGITAAHKAIGPDGTVWSIVRIPKPRRRRRPSAPTRYLALVVRRATDIKEK